TLGNTKVVASSSVTMESTNTCHYRAGGNPATYTSQNKSWIPAFARMTGIARSCPYSLTSTAPVPRPCLGAEPLYRQTPAWSDQLSPQPQLLAGFRVHPGQSCEVPGFFRSLLPRSFYRGCAPHGRRKHYAWRGNPTNIS